MSNPFDESIKTRREAAHIICNVRKSVDVSLQMFAFNICKIRKQMEHFYVIKGIKFAVKKLMCISKQDVRQTTKLIPTDQKSDK
jgi:hypothetical protein